MIYNPSESEEKTVNIAEVQNGGIPFEIILAVGLTVVTGVVYSVFVK